VKGLVVDCVGYTPDQSSKVILQIRVCVRLSLSYNRTQLLLILSFVCQMTTTKLYPEETKSKQTARKWQSGVWV